MTKETEFPLPGVNKEYTEEELRSIQENQVIKKLEVMNDLDKIKYPIMCTVIMEPQPFEYRNSSFWKALEQKDQKVKLQLTDYLNRKIKDK